MAPGKLYIQSKQCGSYQHIELGHREGTYALVQDGVRTEQFPDEPSARSRAALLLTQLLRLLKPLAILLLELVLELTQK